MSPESQPRVVAVGGGKGGVGKSLVAANVGIFLATLGKRVVLVDAALGTPNLHVFAGVHRPSRSLSECLVPGRPGDPTAPAARLADLAVSTPVPGLKLIAGASDPAWVAQPRPTMIRRLVEQIRELNADWVVLDLGSGSAPWILDLFLDADIGILVAVPDPTSVELMHRFVRAAFIQRLRRLGLGAIAALPPAEMRSHEGGLIAPLDLYLRAVGAGDPRVGELRRAILGFAPQLVVNAARSKADMELGRAVASSSRRRLGVPIHYLGHLEYDEAVWVSTRRRRPLLVEHPESRIAKCFERLARTLINLQPPRLDGDVLPSDVHYDLLEVPPTASFEDIRRANRRIRDVYGAESVAVSGLYDPASLEAVHRRLDLAYTTLMDAAKRKEYDLELFPDGVPSPPSPPPSPVEAAMPRPQPKNEESQVAAVRPPMPALGPKTDYSGALLRQIREACGVELREVAERSKIGMAYLQALESETFHKLPASVYVRGFLAEYARILGLDGERVKASYLDRFRAARGATATEGEPGEPDEGSGVRKRPTRDA
ncbi:MAG: helix-turn-helix domain-containing protein [Deltaproteobacteria bacterium]|nr:helix-turn-helix domain-containing protein [Deltaproteobacteria bacterium]